MPRQLSVSDLERAIEGLAQFDGGWPPNICLMDHFGAANICSYWLAISLRFLSFWKRLCDFKFHRIGNIKQCVFYEKWLPERETWGFWEQVELSMHLGGQFIKKHVLIVNPLLFTLDQWNATCYFVLLCYCHVKAEKNIIILWSRKQKRTTQTANGNLQIWQCWRR